MLFKQLKKFNLIRLFFIAESSDFQKAMAHPLRTIAQNHLKCLEAISDQEKLVAISVSCAGDLTQQDNGDWSDKSMLTALAQRFGATLIANINDSYTVLRTSLSPDAPVIVLEKSEERWAFKQSSGLSTTLCGPDSCFYAFAQALQSLVGPAIVDEQAHLMSDAAMSFGRASGYCKPDQAPASTGGVTEVGLFSQVSKLPNDLESAPCGDTGLEVLEAKKLPCA